MEFVSVRIYHRNLSVLYCVLEEGVAIIWSLSLFHNPHPSKKCYTKN